METQHTAAISVPGCESCLQQTYLIPVHGLFAG